MTNTRKNRKKNGKTKKHIFTKKDFVSGDGMMVSLWGPPMWHFLHTMSFNYPNEPTRENKKEYMHFIYQLKYVLPCKYCRINLKKNFKHMPLKMEHMKSRYTFSKYIYDLHEHINKMLNKKSGLSYKDVRERYEHFRSRCTEEKPIMATFTESDKTGKEKGCTEPLYGKKAKCIIKIVPQDDKGSTMQIDSKCIKKRDT